MHIVSVLVIFVLLINDKKNEKSTNHLKACDVEKIQTTAAIAQSIIERGNRKIIFQIAGETIGTVRWINLNNSTLFVQTSKNSGAMYDLERGIL